MKIRALAVALATLAVCDAQAVLVRSFTANSSGPNASPDANETGGGPINLWTVLPSSNSGVSGSFAGNSANNAAGSGAGAGNPAWALYANSGNTSTATAAITTLMARPLGYVGDFISLSFDNGFVDNTRSVGVRLLSPSGSVVSTFSFTGGDSFYRISDGVSSGFSTGVGFTGNGLDLTFTSTSYTGGYSLKVGSTTITGRDLALGSSQIGSIQVFSDSAGSGSNFDVYFNNLSLRAVPEVSPALALPLAAAVLTTLQTLSSRRRDSDE